MAENESIGGIQVEIVGDYSKLQGDIDSAAQVAQQGGAEIAEALNTGAAGADALSSAVTTAAATLDDFDQKVAALVNDGATLAEAIQQASVETANLGSGAEAATGGLGDLATATETAGQEAKTAATAETELATSTQEVGQAAHEASGGLSELGEKFVAFGEALAITEGLKEFGTEALNAADDIKRAEISLTALTGSAGAAEETIKQLEALGIQDGLAMPSLLTAATRMQALLGDAVEVPAELAQIANSAAVMGTTIDAAANAFDRMAASGTLGARQIVSLGLSLDQVADAMNKVSGNTDATAANVTKMFKAMDQSDRVEVLNQALQRLDGIAQKAAQDTFGGQWQSLANQWEQVMVEVGQALLPVISGFTELLKVDILPFIKSVVDGFRELPGPVQEVVVGLGLMIAAVVPLTLAIGGFGLAIDSALAALAPLAGVLGTFGALLGGAVLAGLTGAVLGFSDLKTAMAETTAKEADMDAKFQQYITGLASGAVTQKQISDAQDKINLALSEGLISATKAAQGLSLLDAAEKKLLGNDVAGMLGAMGVQLHIVSDAMSPAAAEAEALAIRHQALRDAVNATRDALVKTTAAYNDNKASAEEVKKSYDAWQTATHALAEATATTVEPVRQLERAWRDFINVTDYIPTSETAAANAIAAQSAQMEVLQRTLTNAQTSLNYWLSQNQENIDVQKQVVFWNDAVTAAQKKLDDATNQSTSDQKTAYGELKNITDTVLAPMPDTIKELSTALVEVGISAKSMGAPMNDAAAILASVGLNMDAASKKTEALINAYHALGQAGNNTLPAEDAMWGAISGQLQKIGQTNMPLVVSLYQQHVRDLQNLGAAEGVVLDAQAKQLQAEIALDTQSGTSATHQIIALQNIKLQQQALYDQTHLLGDLYVSVQNDILKGWDATGKAIADNIIDENDWGQTFLNVGKQVAKMILEDIVGSAFKAMKDALLGLTSNVTDLQSDFVKLGSTISELFGSGKGAAGAAGAGGGGGASGAGGALGGIGNVAGIIDAAASVLSGIVQGIQGARMENLLGEIEVSTRQSDAKLTDVTSVLYKLLDQATTVWGYALPDLDQMTASIHDLHGDLVNILNVLSAGAAPAGGSAPGNVPGSSSVPSGATPPSYVPASVYGGSTSNSNSSIGSVSFTINEAGSPRQTARSVVTELKTLVPSFAIATT